MTRIFHRRDTRHFVMLSEKVMNRIFPSTFIGGAHTHCAHNVFLTPHQPPNTVSLCVTNVKEFVFFLVGFYTFLPECGEILNFIEEKFSAAAQKKGLKKRDFFFGYAAVVDTSFEGGHKNVIESI
jgi:hypothetical protein